jgi:DNA (cytosine-5)-methyltransferase 1
VNDLQVCELFAGIGGFRLGLEKASSKFKTIYANEWDKWAAAIYRHHWKDNTLYEADIKTLQTKDLPEFDLLVGGFPCQPYSICG